jgi:hypothetical protein
MAGALLPIFFRADLPLRIDIVAMAWAYWWATAARAAFVGVLLCVLGLPWNQTLGPVIRHYRQQKVRLPFLLLLGVWLVHLFDFSLGFMLLVDTIALAELLDRAPALIGKRVLDILIPAAYLFVGLLLVFALNHGISGIKFAGAWDGFFNRLDQRIFGATVTDVARWSKIHLPQWFWFIASTAYSNVYGQIGGALAILALMAGRHQALRYTGVILTAYVMALVLFYVMPTMGPFALRSTPAYDAGWFPGTLYSQQALPVRAQLLWQHFPTPELRQVGVSDYYIGFPSMHVAMPIIALWFLRRWRRLAALLVVFDFFIIVGIVLLEWHYFLDILGGISVAALAIAINPTPRDRALSLSKGRKPWVG